MRLVRRACGSRQHSPHSVEGKQWMRLKTADCCNNSPSLDRRAAASPLQKFRKASHARTGLALPQPTLSQSPSTVGSSTTPLYSKRKERYSGQAVCPRSINPPGYCQSDRVTPGYPGNPISPLHSKGRAGSEPGGGCLPQPQAAVLKNLLPAPAGWGKRAWGRDISEHKTEERLPSIE